MHDSDAARMDQEGPGGLPAQGEQGGLPREEPVEDGAAAAARPDLVADTVEALQARIRDIDRDALRGTIDRVPALPPGAVDLDP